MCTIQMYPTIFKLQCLHFLLVLLCLSVADSTLKQLHIVFRHGERTPTASYKNDPHVNMTWPGGWGQLTNRGKLQMYSLGLKLRQLYPDFIPEYYFPEDVEVLSSYADRCLMSAEALLAGLFPPKDKQIWNENLLWQPIPVHYVPRNQDNLLAMKAKCKRYDEEFTRIFSPEKIQKIYKDNAELFDYLTEHTGEEIDTMRKVEVLYNTLEIERLHNLTLPSWTKSLPMDRMREIAARNLASFTDTDFMKRMKGGVFLKHVISGMENEKKGPILFLYSAHDLTLVNILKTLGYTSELKPDFGASFILELHENEVLMEYRDNFAGDPERITLENCVSPCRLNNFKTTLAQFIPTNWDTECNKYVHAM